MLQPFQLFRRLRGPGELNKLQETCSLEDYFPPLLVPVGLHGVELSASYLISEKETYDSFAKLGADVEEKTPPPNEQCLYTRVTLVYKGSPIIPKYYVGI